MILFLQLKLEFGKVSFLCAGEKGEKSMKARVLDLVKGQKNISHCSSCFKYVFLLLLQNGIIIITGLLLNMIN